MIQNGLRERVRIETDGKLMSGRDVAIAAIHWSRRIWICDSTTCNYGMRYDAGM